MGMALLKAHFLTAAVACFIHYSQFHSLVPKGKKQVKSASFLFPWLSN
jgi:hypothetical protein